MTLLLNRMASPVSSVFLLFLVFFATQPLADELLMKDGSRLLGKVVKKEEGTLEFETTYAGVIKVKWSEVSKLTAEVPVKVMLDDESTLVADEIRKTEEATLLASEADAPDVEVTPGKIEYINPEAWRTGEGVKWTGLINIDLELDRGKHLSAGFFGQFDLGHVNALLGHDEYRRQRILRRVHGGAVPHQSVRHEPRVAIRDTQHAAEKRKIARRAIEELPGGGSILIDSGSTLSIQRERYMREEVIQFEHSIKVA